MAGPHSNQPDPDPHSATSTSATPRPDGHPPLYHYSQIPPMQLKFHRWSRGCVAPIATVLVLSFLILGCVLHSNFHHQIDSKGCMMTYMQPSYFRILGFDQAKTRLAGKYGLLLYRDQFDDRRFLDSSVLVQTGENDWTVDPSAKLRPSGVPVLFVPGNAGSAKQVRSMAKEASRYFYETMPSEQGDRHLGSKALDFFTVDFNEEFSAFHGQLILDQAQYVNEAIAYILSLYSVAKPGFAAPRSVLLVGHSMGGIVSRTIFTMDNYVAGSVNTILTVATPHMIPPIALDRDITAIYDRIEMFWREGYISPHSALANVSLVSIMGGNLDITVNSDTGNIHHIVPQSHGFSVFTSTIPHAWVGSDHLSILWCNQVVTAIGRALVDIVDARVPEQVKPLGQRMKVFRGRLLTGLEDHLHDRPDYERLTNISLANVPHTFVEPSDLWAYPPVQPYPNFDLQSTKTHVFVMKIPKAREQDTLSIVTSHNLGKRSRLDVLLCTEVASKVLACERDRLGAAPIPASAETSTQPLFTGDYFTSREFRFVSKRLGALSGSQSLVIVDRGAAFMDPGFLVRQFMNEDASIDTIETTTMGLLMNGFKRRFPETPSLVSNLRLPNLDASLLAYNLKVDRPGCQGDMARQFAPMMKQSSWAMHEDKYSVNIARRAAGVDINFHGDLPYFDKIQLGANRGVELRFWMDPTCREPLQITLQVDKYGSLGKVVIRYRMVVLVFSFMVIVLVLLTQFRHWARYNVYRSFEATLSSLIGSTFWKFSVLLGLLSALQTLTSRGAIDLHSTECMRNITHMDGSGVFGRLLSGFFKCKPWLSGPWLEDALLGGNDAFFWFLAPVFFQVAIGIVALVWMVLQCIVMLLAALYRRLKAPNTSTQRPSVRGRVITASIWVVLVATVVPYQFSFAVSVLVLISCGARALAVAQRAVSSKHGLLL
ncbi:GPI inositol deacylase [Mortierella alpina]|nr:GPI inositol deacylase [Mortierella alpina]